MLLLRTHRKTELMRGSASSVRLDTFAGTVSKRWRLQRQAMA